VDNSRLNLSSISTIINGLSDHDAQIRTIKNIQATINKYICNKNNEKIMTFPTLLKINMRIFYKDPNRINSFLCAYLNTFQASFSVKYTSTTEK
jgi:hypothetical protein